MRSCNGYKRSPLPETTDHPSLITFLQINHPWDLPGHSHSFHPHAWWRKQLRQQHSVPSNCWPTQARRGWWAHKHLHISSGLQKVLVMGEHPAFPQVLELCVVLGYKRGIKLVERNSNKESCPTVLSHFVRFQRASYLVRIWVDLCRGMCTTYWGWRLFLFKCGYQNHRDSGRAHLGHTCTCWSKKCRTSSFIQAQRKELLKNWLYLFWPQKILTNRCRLTRKDLRQLSPSYPRRFWAVYNLLCIK